MTPSIIKVEQVSKKFCKSLKRSMLYGSFDIFKSALGMTCDSLRLRQDEFWAVDNIQFDLKRGETLGIIGSNGSGKSTMLKMLNGIFMPDKGSITINGKVGALIEVGAGFHPNLTGRENIYINGVILGMTKNEIDKKFDSIVDFADLGEFIDTSVKYYSSGMYIRLGFSIAIHCEPDILLIDEILSVGDIDFQNKSFQRLMELKEKISIVLVSHNMGAVGTVCDKTLWLNKGKINLYQDTQTVVNQYIQNHFKKREQELQTKNTSEKSVTNLNISTIELLKLNGETTETHLSGEDLIVRIKYFSKIEQSNISFSLSIESTKSNEVIFCASEISKNNFYDLHQGKGEIICKFKEPNLVEGVYKIGLIIFSERGYLGFLYKNKNLKVFRVEEKTSQKNLAVDKHISAIGLKGAVTIPYTLELKRSE